MIGNITTGKDFRGIVDYLLDPTKTPVLIDTNLAGCDRHEMIAELKLCAEQNYRCQKPVKHISVAFAPEDGEQDYWTVKDIADTIREKLGYGDNQFLVIRHDRIDPGHDRTHNHDHFHILINMIDFEGRRVRDSFERKKLEKILREREINHNLTLVPSSDQREYKAASTGQIQRMMREIEEYQKQERPKVPYTIKIQSGIDLASHDRPSLSVFIARLQRLQIDPKFRIEDNVVKGISYKLQDFKVRGCKLHNASLPMLLKHRVIFDPEHDLEAISMANRDEIVELDPKLDVSWNMTNIRNYTPRKMKQMLDQIFGERESHIAKEVQSETRKTIHPKLEPNSEQTREKDRVWEIG
ncbi:MAG: relaxase/mobilization nuclease domain-containing protein [Pleurocapsa sp. SU_5_0]|nr:relaxase/mobilization nuclease domain-containing protein [Pleurocapsa sp. SU_5_0]